MPASEKFPAPLTSREVSALRALRAKSGPPAKVTLHLGEFSLSGARKLAVNKARGVEGAYRLEAEISGSALGRRAPFASLPVEALNRDSARKIKADLKPEGLRPPWLRVDFLPTRIKLTRNERSHPPFDFDYKKYGVDRPTSVFAPDSRYIYQDTSFPWCTVGRVDTPMGWCTGCTIGSRLLLTGSHCIQWNANNTAGWVRFRPAYYNGSAPFGEAWATNIISWNKANGSDGLTNLETAFDYVVCVLGTRMGDTVGYPGYRTYDDDWNGGSYWQHMGYPSDLTGGARPAFQGSCVVSTVENESTSGQTGFVLGHFNDVVGGHSGGPAWGWWSGEPWPRVVGVQSAESANPAQNTSGDNEFGGGPGLSSLISWARSNYP